VAHRAHHGVGGGKHDSEPYDEARNILRAALAGATTTPLDLGQVIHRRFARLGGIELQLPAREAIRKAPEPGPRYSTG
jgi:antitoxin FitA